MLRISNYTSLETVLKETPRTSDRFFPFDYRTLADIIKHLVIKESQNDCEANSLVVISTKKNRKDIFD